MEGGRSSLSLLLTLVLAAGSLAAVAQFQPPADERYMLVDVETSRGDHARLAVRTGDVPAIPGFANGKHEWFAVTGSESLVPPGSSYGGDDIPGQGLMGNLLRVLVVNNGTR